MLQLALSLLIAWFVKSRETVILMALILSLLMFCLVLVTVPEHLPTTAIMIPACATGAFVVHFFRSRSRAAHQRDLELIESLKHRLAQHEAIKDVPK